MQLWLLLRCFDRVEGLLILLLHLRQLLREAIQLLLHSREILDEFAMFDGGKIGKTTYRSEQIGHCVLKVLVFHLGGDGVVVVHVSARAYLGSKVTEQRVSAIIRIM